MRTCQLCPGQSAKPWNVPLVQSANFRVLVSLGALVEGWVLLVPNEHFLSMGAVPARLIPELQALKKRVSECLESVYGPVCAFEHGPGQERRNVGCGVDHAHLHMVPIAFDLATAAAPYLPQNSRWERADQAQCQAAALDGQDYIYLEQPINRGRILRHQDIGSQILRRAIATHIGVSDDFNWRTHPQTENVNRTIRALGSELSRATSAQASSEYAA
jgi:diadenosine tetraphosphate (Ap4A) HIT family hydrolase